MSRQRLRASFLEVNTMLCPHCVGAGTVKATESMAVTVLRAIENDISKGAKCQAVEVNIPTDVAVYILNYKRESLAAIEARYSVKIIIRNNNDKEACFDIEKIGKYETPEVETTSENLEEYKKLPGAKSKKQDDKGDKVVDFPDKGARKKAVPKDKTKSIFQGLWKKIVD
jgi:hypothetical protein